MRIGILRRHPDVRSEAEVAGELAYFGLVSWWSATFTAAERARIEALFRPPGLPRDSRPLTTGRKQLDVRSAADLLATLADCLRRDPADRSLAMRILSKAEERAKTEDDVLALHLVYQEMVRLHSRWMNHFPEALDLAFGACHKQIAIAPEAARALHEQRPRQPLPIHVGFQTMAILLDREESYAKAIEICKQARFQGWSGNWTWRIGCLAKKLSEHGNPVRSISTSGLGRI